MWRIGGDLYALGGRLFWPDRDSQPASAHAAPVAGASHPGSARFSGAIGGSLPVDYTDSIADPDAHSHACAFAEGDPHAPSDGDAGSPSFADAHSGFSDPGFSDTVADSTVSLAVAHRSPSVAHGESKRDPYSDRNACPRGPVACR